MAKVDLAIARLALGEIFYMDAIPDAVAINEAVDLAKKYSTDESRRFINGILGQIVKKKDEPNSELELIPAIIRLRLLLLILKKRSFVICENYCV